MTEFIAVHIYLNTNSNGYDNKLFQFNKIVGKEFGTILVQQYLNCIFVTVHGENIISYAYTENSYSISHLLATVTTR